VPNRVLKIFVSGFLIGALPLQAQDLNVYRGTQVAPEVERVYERGLEYLVKSQNEDGGFPGNYGHEPATAALSMLAMFAHGDDPNYGPYAKTIKRCLEYLLKSTDSGTGYIGSSMYNHGFSTLALAEAYGAVQDERIGPALKRAVELILTSQEKNRSGKEPLQSLALQPGFKGRGFDGQRRLFRGAHSGAQCRLACAGWRD
jgi:hypothetical protein